MKSAGDMLNKTDSLPPAPGAAAPVVATIRDVWKSFRGRGGSDTVHVLEGINLEVRAGEFIVIVGPSGCGKSTLLSILGGFETATRGEVLIEGEQVNGPDRRRLFVFQENAVFPWLTVERNVAFGLSTLPPERRAELVRHYIDLVGLTGFEKAYPRELSGGMRQRTELARVLAANPELIYMDEPFGALDYITRLKLRADLVRLWQQERKTILFVTHDIDESVQLADRIVVMSRRPATIARVIRADLPRPRDMDSPAYIRVRDEVFAAMGMNPHLGV